MIFIPDFLFFLFYLLSLQNQCKAMTRFNSNIDLNNNCNNNRLQKGRYCS